MKVSAVLVFCCVCAWLIIALGGCAGIESNRNVIPDKLLLSDNLQLPFKADKCLYDQRTGTYFILEQSRPNIYLYRNKKQINLLGGFGTDKTNFQKLSDIALDPDGNLLALDEFARLIRKYNPEGSWIADIDVSALSQPNRFCVTPDGDLIIYDSASKELQRISSFDGKAMFTFGRFQVESVSGITAGRDLIAVVANKKDKTVLFSGMGLLLKEIPAQVVLDQYQNQYEYADGAVKLIGSELRLPMGKPNEDVRLCASGQSVLLVYNETVISIFPVYRGN